jgi:AcrR family transcriptional regulator
LQIPRKAFYRYFSDKDGALQSLMDHALMDFDTYSSVNGIVYMRDAQMYMEKVLDYLVEDQSMIIKSKIHILYLN